jgi:hypothetical protein
MVTMGKNRDIINCISKTQTVTVDSLWVRYEFGRAK